MNIEELITTYERKVKNLENECRGNASIAKAVSVAKLTAARQTLNELNSLRLDFVSGSLPTDDDIDNLTCEEMDEGEVYPPDYYTGFTNGAYWMKGKVTLNDH